MDVTNAIGRLSSVATQTGKTIAPRTEVKIRVDAGAAATAPKPAEPVRLTGTRIELDVDKITRRFIGRLVDSDTGAVVKQIPSEAMIRLLEKTREMIGALLDKTA